MGGCRTTCERRDIRDSDIIQVSEGWRQLLNEDEGIGRRKGGYGWERFVRN